MGTAASRKTYREWVVKALRELGPARPRQVYDWIRSHESVPAADLAGLAVRGENLFEKTVRWARKDLFDEGVILAPERGVWSLSK